VTFQYVASGDRPFAPKGETFEKAVAFQGTRIHAHINLGWNNAALGRLAESEDHFRSALEIDSMNIKALKEIAPVLVKRKKIPEATEFLERAVAIAPGDSVAHLNLGLLYKAAGRRDDARREFERSAAIDPNFAPPRRELNAGGAP
jgi:tetratricopeptide (TPR) repeat protein